MKSIEITAYRINRLLHETGWSQAALGRKIGVSQQTVNRWAQGVVSPTTTNLDKLTEVTGYPPYWFMLPPDDEDQRDAHLPVKMKSIQLELLQIFEAFPKQEQEQMLKEMKEKKEKAEETVARWLEAKKDRRA